MNVRAVYPRSLCRVPAVVTGGCVRRSRRPSTAPTTTKTRLAVARALCSWNHQPFLFLKRAMRMAAGTSIPQVLPMTTACLCMTGCMMSWRPVLSGIALTLDIQLFMTIQVCSHTCTSQSNLLLLKDNALWSQQDLVTARSRTAYREVSVVSEVLGPKASTVL